MPNLSRLGGPLSSQSKATVLKLYADQPLLLRGTAYDTYTGSSWNTDWDEKKSGRYVYGDAANDAQSGSRSASTSPLPKRACIHR